VEVGQRLVNKDTRADYDLQDEIFRPTKGFYND